MSGPTTGPLEVGYYTPTEKFRAVREHVAVMKPDGQLIATTGPTGDQIDVNDSSHADARLYVAASELLAALSDLMRDVPPCSHQPEPEVCRYCFARATIAKARGS